MQNIVFIHGYVLSPLFWLAAVRWGVFPLPPCLRCLLCILWPDCGILPVQEYCISKRRLLNKFISAENWSLLSYPMNGFAVWI